MSLQPANLGRLWLGPQTAKGAAATTFYGYKANMVGIGAQQMLRAMGMMVGSNLVPAGSVKTAAWGSGAAVMPLVLDDYIGWLLYGFCGSVSSVDNGDGTYTHTFPSGADSIAVDKYLTARRKVPAATALYEQITDLRPFRMLMAIQPGQFANLRAELIGRQSIPADGSGWTFSAKSPEVSTPVSCNGTFTLGGTAYDTSNGLSIEMVNVVPNLEQVLVNGSLYPYDFPVLGRAITVRFNFLWKNKDLYDSIYYGGGAAIDPLVYSAAYQATIQSAGYITGTTPYSLTFDAANMDWQAEPVELAGGDLVQMAVTGTLKAAVSGYDWRLQLTNGTASYAWPA